MATLKQEMDALRQDAEATVSPDVMTILQRSTQRLADSGIADSAAGVGDSFPRFSLPNVVGSAVNSEELLEQGPLVICFYRGGWCPYCNLELRAYQSILPEIRKLGGDFVAISPQLPEEGFTMAAKGGLNFEVLSDTGNSLAEHLGLMFELPSTVVDIYRGAGYDLERINGNVQWTLPLAATFVINQESVVIRAFVNPDYTVRLEPETVLETLRAMA
jgi:peroxiredoxin